MYIIYSGTGNQYASAAVSKRSGNDTSIDTIYLGKVVDQDAGVYKSKVRGYFTFDPDTCEFGRVPDNFVLPDERDKRKRKQVSVDFGDAFFMNAFLCSSGMMEVVDTIGYGNPDTLHAMLLFYTLSGLANCDAIQWFEGNIVRMLYPKANMTSQRISDFLASIGTPEKQMVFQKSYINFVLKHYNPDKNILIDSSGLPNNMHVPLTCRNIHNGKVSNEIRLIFVVQKSTGIPLYYRAVPGNIVDVSTLSRIFLHLDSLGIDVASCILDAGYNSGDNLDLFYDENHQCRIGFITRIGSGDKTFKTMVNEELADIEQKENFVKYEDRYLFIKKKQVMVGSGKNQPAWLYLGLDCSRMTDEQHKLMKRAKKNRLSLEAVYEAMQMEGVFGVLSGENYGCDEILPAYYQRQAAEQIFDFAKNYTKLLPLRTGTEETFQGHLLLSYIASCAVKMIQLRLKEANLFFGSRLACLRNQKCTIYEKRIVTDEPQKEANDTYKAFDMVCPDELPVINGKLVYNPPESEALHPDQKRKKRKTNVADTDTPVCDESEKSPQKKHGRPKGSKNKRTVDRGAIESANAYPPATCKRGRPKGSKNRKTIEREILEAARSQSPKRKRGRPKGSKNKKTSVREALQENS